MTPPSACSKNRDPARLRRGAALLTLLAAACGDATTASEEAVYTVRPTDMRVSVIEGGTLESQDPLRILSEIEGQTTILWIRDEGATVQAGDKLVELDVASLRDKLTSQQIRVKDALADKITAEQNLIIQENLQESNIKRAELDRDFAALDLEKFEKGTYVQDKEEIEAEITLAEAEIKRAADRLDWSRRLNEKGFLTRTELEADELAKKKRDIDESLARRRLEVFQTYSSRKDLAKLRAEHEEAERELARVRAKAESALAQARADKDVQAAKYDLELSILQKLEAQIGKGVLVAPRPGLVVYWREQGGGMRGGSERPIEAGASVRERQTIMSLPDLDRLMAKLSIHESAIEKIAVDQPAIIRFDAMPNVVLGGVVTRVAPVPDSQSSWLNPDLRVYTTEVLLVDLKPDHRLRPGMSCSVEIVVADLKQVIAVPLAAVKDNGADHFCYVRAPDGPVARAVTIGHHNNSVVHVTEGLAAGDVVYLNLENPPALPAAKTPAVAVVPAIVPADAAGAAATSQPESRPGRSGRGRRQDAPPATEEERFARAAQMLRRFAPDKADEFEAASPERKREMLKEMEAMRQRMREGGGGGGRPDRNDNR